MMKRILSLIAVLMMAQMIFSAKVQVTNTSDDATEVGSLRWACETATAEDTIVFEFAKSGDKVIHISKDLTPKASVDGSTWADSIIIDGLNLDDPTKRSYYGFSSSGNFIRKIVVQNCVNGFAPSTGAIVYDCVARNCLTYGFNISSHNISIIRCSAKNNDYGIYSSESSNYRGTIEDCVIEGNRIRGISAIHSVIGCKIYDNKIGICVIGGELCDEISNNVISGNDSVGVLMHIGTKNFTDNIIGLTDDQKNVYPNGIGLDVNRSRITKFHNNVISGNKKDGILNNERCSISSFKNNYIGTNIYFDSDSRLGNGGNGFIPGNIGVSYPEISNNYFGNNSGYAIYQENVGGGTITLNNVYIGITPDGKPMPNGKGGLLWGVGTLNLNDCHIGYNKGAGIKPTAYGAFINVKGGSVSHNEGNGIEYINLTTSAYLDIEKVTFDANGKSAIFIDANKYSRYLISECEVLNTERAYSAFNSSNPFPEPEFTSYKITDKNIVLEGKIDTAAVAKIEMFFTSQGEQTAEVFVDSFYTDSKGNFSVSLDRNNKILKDAILPAFAATATYNKNASSGLSDLAYPEPAAVDLTKTEFYVKVDGLGNGSSWENAMSPQTFAYTLPKVKDGTTFFVAEGTYYPMYDRDMNLTTSETASYVVNSDVSIKGGYPANATKGAESNPGKYATIFDGDLRKNDESADTLNALGISVPVIIGMEDNCDSLFIINKSCSLDIDGVSIVNSKCGIGSVNNNISQKVNLDRIKFSRNRSSIALSGDRTSTLSIKNSEFKDCESWVAPTVSIFEYGELKMDTIDVHNVAGCFLQTGSDSYSEKSENILDSVLLYNNTSISLLEVGNNNQRNSYLKRIDSHHNYASNGIVQGKGHGRIEIVNSKFEKNQCDNDLYYNGATNFYVINTAIAQNEFKEIMRDWTYFYTKTFSRCIIENNISKSVMLDGIAYHVEDCIIRNNVCDTTLWEALDLRNCLIESNRLAEGKTPCCLINKIPTYSSRVGLIENNTITGNKGFKHIIGQSTGVQIRNNTIVDNIVDNEAIRLDLDYNTTVAGNILASNRDKKGIPQDIISYPSTEKISLNSNILSLCFNYSSECYEVPNVTNILLKGSSESSNRCSSSDYYNPQCSLSDVFSVMDGKYDSDNGKFYPNLNLNDGFTHSIALKSDVLPDGTSLRFHRISDITTDQRGVNRLDSTCMGSYEIPCMIDTTYATDTITVGESFNDSVFTVIGRHDSINVTFRNDLGCESVISYALFVKPNSDSLNYYVKTDRSGRGDGSSWENAMNGDDFAACLPLAPDGSTFYVAEGNYKPIYDKNLKVPEMSKDLTFFIQSSVTIKGGYPNGIIEDIESDPENYKTVFESEYNIETKDCDISYSVFSVSVEGKTVVFDGIAIEHACSANDGIRLSSSNSNIILNKVYATENEGNVLDGDCFDCNVSIDKSYFYDNNGGGIRILNIRSLDVKNTSFKRSKGFSPFIYVASDDIEEKKGSRISFDSCSFYNIYHTYGFMTFRGVEKFDFTDVDIDSVGNGIYDVIGLSQIDSVDFQRSLMSRLTSVKSYNVLSSRGAKWFQIEDCRLTNNKATESLLFSNADKCIIESSTFDGNKANATSLVNFNGNELSLINNTIVNDSTNIIINDGAKIRSSYINNTIVGNICAMPIRRDGYVDQFELIGNVILGNGSYKYLNHNNPYIYPDCLSEILPLTNENAVVSNNVMNILRSTPYTSGTDYSTWKPSNSSNILVKPYNLETEAGCIICPYAFQDLEEDVLSSLYEGSYDNEIHLFSPILEFKGGFTPVLSLKKDKLSDGTTIRFPRVESVVTDQRGVTRLENTCMGSYEINCSPSVTLVTDTVLVGEPYTFLNQDLDQYTVKVGSYNISDTLISREGCDSIINLSLAVRPQKNDNGYYVKVNGTGDGSDWKNAMSPETFAEYLPLVYDGETFHIAAGNYKSSYKNSRLGRVYNINSSVTLIGGYPDTVTTIGVPPMPENFSTVLTAKGGTTDYINVYSDRLGDYSIYGFGDNDSVLIYVNGSPSISLYGLTLSGVRSCYNGAITMRDGGELNMDRCYIANNNASAVVARNVKVNFLNSEVANNVAGSGVAFNLVNSSLNVENSSFHENVAQGACGSEASNGGIADVVGSSVNFTNNTIVNNWADNGGVMSLSSSSASFVNNTVVGNASLITEPKGSFVFASDDKSKVSLFGNMVVGNGVSSVYGATIVSEGYNILSSDMTDYVAEKDMLMKSSEVENILDGKPAYSNSDVFVATLGDNGGYTRTVAVIQSLFEGGEVISIPRELRRVDFDQRGMVRKDTSCIGAFEFPTYMNYFVKQSPLGDGTGRDWNNAMGDTTFAKYFSIVPSGATFHVAAGTYRPLEDRLYETKSHDYSRYYSCRPVNVYGGYHPQAQIGAVANPIKYVTLLSADYNGDDHFEVSSQSYTINSYSNTKDNSSYVMSICSKIPGQVHLKGLTFSGNYTKFRGSSAALSVSKKAPEIPFTVKLDSCSFEKTYVGIYSSVDTLLLNACRFDTLDNLAVSHYPTEYVPSLLSVDNSSFTNLDNAVYVYASNGKAILNNSTFSNVMALLQVYSTAYGKASDYNLELTHNTFSFSPKSYVGINIPNFISIKAKGNIFNTGFMYQKSYSEYDEAKNVESDYNLFVETPTVENGTWTLGEHDILVSPSDLVGVLPGEMVDERFSASSILKDTKDFTKVVALLSDILKDGQYVRMPIEEASVKVDQIATERLDLTTLGAYEIFNGRDTVISDKIDTVCLGLNYQRNGWDLNTDTLSEGIYSFERFARGKIATDTIFNLELHVNPFDHIRVDQVVAQPTLCHGDGYGIVSLTPHCNIPGSTDVYVINSLGDTVSSDVNSFNIIYKNEEMLTGRYTLSISPITQCVVDTSVPFEIFDRDSLHAMPCADNILTSCANEPTSELKISLVGYHPAMKFYYDSVEVNSLTKGFELISDENAAVSSLADVQLSAIPVGFHTIYAIDACENQYPVKEFTVAVPSSELVDMELVEYTMDSLPCGLDLGAAKVHVVAGASANFSLKSTNGYVYSRLFTDRDTVLSFEDLPRGRYEVLLKKYGTDCTDSVYASFEIKSPEPLSLSLTSNGAACVEGEVNVFAQGGRGNYVYHWTNPLGEKADSVSPILNEVSAGNYICVVEDSVHCMSLPDTLTILPNVENLLPLSVDSVAVKNITCFNGNNGTIEVYFSTENIKQSVACSVTNKETGEVIGTSDTYEHSKGLLAIRTLPVGSFSYEVYYGTETCRLDTTSFKGEFSVAAKEVPFAMDPLKIFSPQTCLSKPDGITVTSATGWEEDYKANLVSSEGGVYPITPVKEDGVTKLYAALLSGGHTYYYQVLDACGSEMLTERVEFPLYELLSLTVDSHTDSVVCARATDAEITFTVAGGILDNHKAFVNDRLFDEKGSIVCDKLGKGDYYVSFKSVNASCPDSVGEYVRIAGPDTLAIKYTLTGNCATSKLIATASGECGSYSYLWSDGTQSMDGDENIPYALEAGKTYSLTITDDHACDHFEKSFTIPTADQLPSISQKVYPESEKCYQGNNGSILIHPSLSAPLDFAITATISYRKVGTNDSVSVECVLDPDNSYSTPRELAPGEYQVVTYLGSMDCDMGVAPAVKTVKVDALPPLKIQSEFTVTDHTCFTPNGSVQFNVEGWTYTHTADIYKVGDEAGLYLSDVKVKSTTAEYVGVFDIQSMPYGDYKVVVKDICGNTDESETFEIEYKPTTLKNITTKQLTCINEPNGVLDFEVHGWTSHHACSVVKNDNVADGRISPALPERIDEEKKIAYFHIDTMQAGKWRIWVANECGEAFHSDNLNEVKGIDPYKIGKLPSLSKTELDCPYSEDGEITVLYYGGYKPGEFVATRNSSVPVNKLLGYELQLVERLDTIKIEQIMYDSTRCDTTYHKEVVGAARDTVVTMYVNCPPMIDPETGAFLMDSIEIVYTVLDSIYTPVYGFVDSTTYDTLTTRMHVPSDIRPSYFNILERYFETTDYYFKDLSVGEYVFRYQSAVEGCTDNATDTVRITRPKPVYLLSQTLDISCTDSTDGQISLKPLRGADTLPDHPKHVISHNPTKGYEFNDLYVYSNDSVMSPSGMVPSSNHTPVADENGNAVSHRIDVVNDKSDFQTITWTYQKEEGSAWQTVQPVLPSSVDSTEQYYYDASGNIIRTAVFSNFHLDDFWIDSKGTFQYSDVQSLANLNSGRYAVEVTDSKACVYHDTIKVRVPESALQIVSIGFDEQSSICEPKDRQIHVEAKGGWGKYIYSFTDLNKLDVPMSTKSNGYRGGEAAHYDSVTVSGWCDSKYLEPGDYTVFVMDEKGCIVKSDRSYKVRTNFELKSDTVQAICPRDPLSATEVYFDNYVPSGKYNLYDLVSDCSVELLDSCRNKSFKPLLTSAEPVLKNGKYTFGIELSTATHGVFVYEDKQGGCGTYVESTVIDTLIPMSITMKRDSIDNLISLCYDSDDATAQFFVKGGTPEYALVRNSDWGVRDTLVIDGEPQVFHPQLESKIENSKTTTGADTTIVKTYLTIPGLKPGNYFFSIVDQKGCVRPYGGDSIDSIVVKRPDPLKVEFAPSIICPSSSITKGGNIFFNKPSGGTAPYTFSYAYNNGPVSDCDAMQEIPEGDNNVPIYMAMTDANGCVKDTITQFVDDDFVFENIDFWASTKRYKGDVLALIDNCEPASALDSVVYTFTNPVTHEVDSRIETLDKRMYIYDIENGAELYKEALKHCLDTKAEVSDAYFKNHFNLLVDQNLAKHISFIRMNDNTGSWVEGVSNMDSVWVMHDVKMTAYFKGCAYETQYRELQVNYDSIQIYNGGLPRGGDIVSLTVAPNPCTDFTKTTVKAVFSKKMDADLYVYHMNGTSEMHFSIKANDPVRWKDGTKYDDPEFEISLADLKANATSTMNDGLSEVMVVFIKTARDAQSTYVMVNPSLLNDGE